MIEQIKSKLQTSIDLKTSLLSNKEILNTIEKITGEIVSCYKHDGKVLWCGNGGSAADSQHLAAELSGRYYYDRPPLFSEALHVNTSYITAVANDYSYDEIYARLVRAMGRKGDVLIGLSTSGNSANVIKALNVANEIGMVTVGFTGETGGKMKGACKYLVNIPSIDTPRIQECHMLFGHTICELVETSFISTPIMLKEAIILAGGFGTRLREVVSDVPKPMAPVNDKPFLDYLLRYLGHYGIERVILSVGHLSEKIISHYGNNFNGIEIVYSVEREPLGTGGGIRLAMEKCKSYDVLVLNGDSFFSIDLHSFYNKYSDSVADGALALRYTDNCARYGTIILGEMDIIKAFNEKTGHKAPGVINAGVYILSRDIYMEETHAEKNFSIEKDFFEKKLNKLTLYGFTYNGYFIDIGIPEDYKQAQHDFKTFKY